MSFEWNPLSGTLDLINKNALSSKTLVLTRIADENISALKLIRLTSSTNCALADNRDFNKCTVFGLSISAGLVGTPIKILRFGVNEDLSFTFNLNDYLFLGQDGNITDIEPISPAVAITRVGFGLGTGGILIDVEKPIYI